MEIKRNRASAIPILIIFLLNIYLFYRALDYNKVYTAVLSITVAPLYYLTYLLISYTGEGSRLYGWKNLVERLPAVKKPGRHVRFKEKFLWTSLILIIYFVLSNIYIYGLDRAQIIDVFASFRSIFAGQAGSIMDLGIGPIVTASIIMQLFVGAKIINIDLTKSDDKALYQSAQKLLVILMIFVEAVPQVFGYLPPDPSFISAINGTVPGYGLMIARIFIIFQLFMGSYLVFMMDEVVSKWGIGSGVSLFIAAGVSQALITGTLNWVPTGSGPLSISNPPSGAIPKTFYLLSQFNAGNLYSGGLERIIFAPPNPLIALAGTFFIFFLIVWVQSVKVELPLAHERARGARGRYPIQLMYASNIPVILAAAVLANLAMWSLLFWTNPTLAKIPILGHDYYLGAYPSASLAQQLNIQQTTPIGGLAWYLANPNGLANWLFPMLDPQVYQTQLFNHPPWEMGIHVLAYVAFMVGASVLFAKFWIETTNMNSEGVARQIQSSGMQIPGFRRDPRVLKRVLDKYIPAITVFSGAAVGALAASADLIGTVGNASGTGVLLTVGIVIQLYQAMGREQMTEMYPFMRDFFGGM
ncbi:MAG: preprotein translocase subunit SecY [Thermoplasmata archaeon]